MSGEEGQCEEIRYGVSGMVSERMTEGGRREGSHLLYTL